MKRLLLVVAVLIGGWYWLMWSRRIESDPIPSEHAEAVALMRRFAAISADERQLLAMTEARTQSAALHRGRVAYSYRCEKHGSGWIITATPDVAWSYTGSWVDRVVFLNTSKWHWYEFKVDTTEAPVFLLGRIRGEAGYMGDPIVIDHPTH